jgi:hypothetical protein
VKVKRLDGPVLVVGERVAERHVKGVPRSKDFLAVDPQAGKDDSKAGETDE